MANPDAVDLSLIIVSWNIRELLKRCLESVYAAPRTFSMEVFVVDNNSSDGTAEMVKSGFPSVILLEQESNLGFARANNVALRRAHGRNLLLLNPDTVVRAGAIGTLIEILRNCPDFGIVGPKLLNPDGSIQFVCAREFPSLLTEFFELSGLRKLFPEHRIFGRWYMSYWDHEDSRDVQSLSGACMMVRRQVVDAIDGLDERFFIYGEDIDMCYQAWTLGWRLHYCPEAEVVHFGAQSTAQVQHVGVEGLRAMNQLLHKWHGSPAAWVHRFLVVVAYLPRTLLEALHLTFHTIRDTGVSSERIRYYLAVLKWTVATSTPAQSTEAAD